MRAAGKEAGMDLHGARNSATRFSVYVEGLVSVIGHADRAAPLRDYCVGLVMPGERKSVEPMAAVTAPARVAVQRPSQQLKWKNSRLSDLARNLAPGIGRRMLAH
jgi:SRSO17 transposase